MRIFNSEQAAEYLDLNIRTIQKQAKKGRLKSKMQKPYVFTQAQLDQYRDKVQRKSPK